MEVVKGQIIHSRQGRDVTKPYVAIGTQGDRLLLCDGAKWTLACPKRKNPRHCAPTATFLPEADTETDLKIKRALGLYARRGQSREGG